MRKAALLLTLVATTAVVARAAAAPAYKGMSYTSFGQNVLATAGSDLSLSNLADVGTDTVALNFWWFQDSVTSNSLAADFSRYSSTVSSIEHAIDTIHGLGMKVLLKPMLDVGDGTWRAYINPSDRDLWFANYTNFLGTFADIAEAKGVELYSIGCELNNMEDTANNGRWTDLISNIRSRYDGELTYSANHSPADGVGGGYESVAWWDQLDYIGIDAYFPLSPPGQNNTTLAQLTASWQSRADTIESWRTSRGLTQRVLFTEVGYQSVDGSTQTPWGGSGPVDLAEQADAYEALLTVMSDRSWWDGAFWWSWETNPYAGGPMDTGFTPQNKPAQDVLQSFYGGPGPPPPPTGAPTQTFFSWESGLEGWQVPAFAGRPATNGQSSVGATAGEHSLAVTQTGSGFSWDTYVTLTGDALTAFSLALVDGPSQYRIEFDVTYDTAFIPQGSVTFISNYMAINNAAGNWTQVDGIASTNGRTNQTIHVALPLTSWTSLAGGSSSYSFYLAINGNWGSGSATVFYDNFRLVNINAPLTGDYNSDGLVDAADYTVWRNTLGSTDDLRADGNLNGVVDATDYQLWKANFGTQAGAGSGIRLAAVPEPESLLLGGLAALFTIFLHLTGQGREYLLSSCSSALPSTKW